MKIRFRRIFRRLLAGLSVLAVVLIVSYLIYFPGRQGRLAFVLATGLGVSGLQEQVDRLEAKAIGGEPFSEEDKQFLSDLYTCFAKGGKLTVTLRQSGRMMDRYLSGTGEALRTEPRIFLNSRKVAEQINRLKRQIAEDLPAKDGPAEEYSTGTFYMGDPDFLESMTGLYYGHLSVRPQAAGDGTLTLRWRAEVPWQWPSYESLFEKHGDYHAQCFPLPNARSWLQGAKYCLRIDDGLGEHLSRIGLAKPFLVYSEWEEPLDAKDPDFP
jgi:hypothetical protein